MAQIVIPAFSILVSLIVGTIAGIRFGWWLCQKHALTQIEEGLARVDRNQTEMEHYLKTTAGQRTALLTATQHILEAMEPGLPRCRVGMADQLVSAVEELREARNL